jgi:hypothetical protein
MNKKIASTGCASGASREADAFGSDLVLTEHIKLNI